MKLYIMLLAGLVGQSVLAGNAAAPNSTPKPFTSGFHQPAPPIVQPDFRANWNQHKWNVNVSHISSGFGYFSTAQQKVRVDEAYDGTLGSSLFDYGNVTAQGVNNILWTLSPAITSKPQVFEGYTEPAFPLIPADLLVQSSAVYAGVLNDPTMGEVSLWNFMYYSTTPVTIFVDSEGVIHGYDYWNTNERTFATTRFFDIIVGKVDADVFDFPHA